jgi:hypothetical protein
MTKPHFRAIFIVIATNNNEYFKKCRRVWKSYSRLCDAYKVFFVYGHLDEPLENRDEYDLIFDSIEENYEITMIEKNILALEAIQKIFSYDYLIRTNLSTFWNLFEVENVLAECPREMCYAGTHDLSPFYIPINEESYVVLDKTLYSGVCMIFTPDLVDALLENKHNLDTSIADDLSVGALMQFIPCNTFTTMKKEYMEIYSIHDSDTIVKTLEKAIEKKCAIYRVKNTEDREQTDGFIFQYLLKQIYKIDLVL